MLRRAVPAALLAVAAAAVLAPPARASVRVCLPVLATGVGQDQGNFTTTATISSFGLPLGTTAATFVATGGDAPTVTFSGPIKFTSRIGTLTAQSDGSVNLATGAFASRSTSLSGTGAFRGVTGALSFAGTENLDNGAFTEKITGRLCF